MAYQPQTDSFWTEDGLSHSSQWADLCTIWIVITHEHGLLSTCKDSWAVFCRSTLWLPQWEQQWTIMEKHLWGQEMWRDIYLHSKEDSTLYNVSGHSLLKCPGNDEAYTLAHSHWLEEAPEDG